MNQTMQVLSVILLCSVFQWILRKKHCASYMGSVGKDDFSKILETKAEEAGVQVKYQKQDDHPTGEILKLFPPPPLHTKAPHSFLHLLTGDIACSGNFICPLDDLCTESDFLIL